MANRLYNKQVSPKGYMKGGRVKKMGGGMMMQRPMMQRPMMQEGGRTKKMTEAQKQAAKKTGKKVMKVVKASVKPFNPISAGTNVAKKIKERMDATDMMKEREKRNNKKFIEKFKKAGSPEFSKGGRTKKMTEAQKQAAKKTGKKVMKVAKTIGKIVIPAAGAADIGVKLAKRLGRKMGGSLKPVNPQTQKGLSKLPTEVRNKMGYMKKGGKVHGK